MNLSHETTDPRRDAAIARMQQWLNQLPTPAIERMSRRLHRDLPHLRPGQDEPKLRLTSNGGSDGDDAA
jgi:hypothetical protein